LGQSFGLTAFDHRAETAGALAGQIQKWAQFMERLDLMRGERMKAERLCASVPEWR